MIVMLHDGMDGYELREIPDGSTYVVKSEAAPHIQDYSGRAAGITEVPRLEVRFVWSGRYDRDTGAALFVPDFLL